MGNRIDPEKPRRGIRNRRLGAFLATMLVAGNMVGSGIFLLPATLAEVGSITVIGLSVAAAGALAIAVVLAQLGRAAPRPGGPCTYAGEAMGPYMGFQASAIYWVSCWTVNIAIAAAAVGYLASFFPALGQPLHAAIAAATLIWLLSAANIAGPRFVCQLQTIAMAVGILPIVAVVAGGWRLFDSAIFHASWNITGEPAFKVVPRSLALVFWAFTGLESASVAAAVVDNPRRNVPIATIGGVLIGAFIYVSSIILIMGLIPAGQLARSTAPFADAAQAILGPKAAALVGLGALIKATGSLGGWVLMTAQTAKAAADRGLFPSMFGRVDRAGIPVLSLVFMALFMTVVVFGTMSPTLGQQFGKLINVSVVLTMLVYVYACVAMWHYAEPAESGESAGWSGGAGRSRIVALIAMSFSLFVIALSDSKLLSLSATAVFLTYPLYPLCMRRLRGA